MKTINPTVILSRISDRKQENGYSLDAQVKYAHLYCEANKLNLIAEPFVFVETASKSSKRSKFDEMLKFISAFIRKSKNPLHLVVEKKDRLTRNFTSQELLQEWVQNGKLVIHYYKDKKILDASSSPADIFNDDIQTAVAKYQSLNTRREVTKGMKQKASNGWYPCRAPLGYINVRIGKEDKNGRKEAQIHVDPDERNVRAVRRIFELRATQNLSYLNISKTILAENLLPPHKTKSFGKGSVESILTNSFYDGRYKWMEEWHTGQHEIIIPTEHLDAVFNAKVITYKNGARGLFSGFLSCAVPECRCQITYDPKKRTLKSGEVRKYEFYHCSDGKRYHKDNGEKQIIVKEDDLLEKFAKPISEISISDKLAKAISLQLKRTHEKALAANRRTLDGFKQALLSIEQQEDELYDDHKKGLLSEESYHRRIEKLRQDRRKYTEMLQRGQDQIITAFYQTNDKIIELANNAKSLWLQRNPQEKLEMLKAVLSNQTLDGATLCYELKKPFRLVSEMKKNEQNGKWRTRSDSNARPPDS